MKKLFPLLAFLFSLFFWRCVSSDTTKALYLPDGFDVTVFIDYIPETTRHLAVSPDGTLYAKFDKPSDRGVLMALKDLDSDGIADTIQAFGRYTIPENKGYSTAVRIYDGYLYFSSKLAVYRYKIDPNQMTPSGSIETIVIDDHAHGTHEHISKPITFDDKGNLYVPFGAPSNACQSPKRTPLQPGLDPCPQLEDHAGIWRFNAHKLNQTQKDGERYATGIRSLVAMDWNHQDQTLYGVMHGRDDLFRLWPDRYTAWQSALLPAEEFIRIEKGDDFGWPYCYYDQVQEKKVLAPEYGGDGNSIGRCDQSKYPIMGFPGHWAPNDLVFYTGNTFPERYKNGAFIAFHGSTNRSPYSQAGYFIGFIPFENGIPTGEWEVFADGFAKIDTITSVKDAEYRPMGIAFSEDGKMYIGDTEKGRVWQIQFNGNKANFGAKELAKMEERKKLPHIKTPDQYRDVIETKKDLSLGAKTYNIYCNSCHQANGKGASGRFPSLVQTDWVTGNKERLIEVILLGMEGPIEVNGQLFNGIMPQHKFLKDDEIAEVLTYIRTNFGNTSSAISKAEVAEIRKKIFQHPN